ncbi:MAG: threonine/serine exporter family protein [Eubacterium sp.]|nr:threonine/serine exporter family protein [Eubacterium sp.]
MKEALIQVVTAAIGSLGFSIYFRVREKNVIAAMAGGAIGWIVYLILFHFTKDLFISNFAAAFIVFVWAEIMARILKAPSNTYLIPGIIPLIPGGSLYYTMKGVVDGNQQLFAESGKNTVFVAFGMAAGMVVAAVVFHYIIKIQGIKKRKNK